jgi:5'-3' exonuclease
MKSQLNNRHVHPSLNTSNDQVRYACIEHKYGVTPEQINRVIALVGNNPKKVEEYLKGKLFSYLAYKDN